MRIVVITGGIATGKSTADKTFRELGVPIIDCDEIVHEHQEPNGPAYKLIHEHFGDKVIAKDGTLDRKALSAIVFQNEQERRYLNHITHPLVYKTLLYRTFKLWITGASVVILDIPLFFEGKIPSWIFNDIITVSCSPEKQIERLMQRNNMTQEEAEKRIKPFMPLSKKCEMSTIVINNDGSEKELIDQVKTIVNNWKTKSPPLYKYPHPLLLLAVLLLFFALIFKLHHK